MAAIPPETSRILVALDYSSADDAMRLVDQLSPDLCGLKVGKELFTAAGPELVRKLVDRGYAVFLDLKFHDIPNTVAAAVRAAAGLGVWMVNVHASGGESMMRAARDALVPVSGKRPLLTAVTVLTSMSTSDIHAIGVRRTVHEQVNALAGLASACGLDGVVCSAHEALELRKILPKDFLLVTPGIRVDSSAVEKDDQQRIVTPAQAIRMGSDYLVIGRPVTRSANPVQTLLTIKEEISYIHH